MSSDTSEVINKCISAVWEEKWWIADAQLRIYVRTNRHYIGLEERGEYGGWTTNGLDCDQPGVIWTTLSDSWQEELVTGWYCHYHATGDKSKLPTITLDEYIQIQRDYYAECHPERELASKEAKTQETTKHEGV